MKALLCHKTKHFPWLLWVPAQSIAPCCTTHITSPSNSTQSLFFCIPPVGPAVSLSRIQGSAILAVIVQRDEVQSLQGR